ncbi:MAG: hypothetical protein IJ065_10880 [Eubacterium sp.]|nr:hypothetical protein [Eubacterium sp.]
MYIREKNPVRAFLWLLLIPVILVMDFVVVMLVIRMDLHINPADDTTHSLFVVLMFYILLLGVFLGFTFIGLFIITAWLIFKTYKGISFRNELAHMLVIADTNSEERLHQNVFNPQKKSIILNYVIYLTIGAVIFYLAIHRAIMIYTTSGTLYLWDIIISGVLLSAYSVLAVKNIRSIPSSIIFHDTGIELGDKEIEYKNIEIIRSSCSIKNLTGLFGCRCITIYGDFGKRKILIGQDIMHNKELRLNLLTTLYLETKKHDKLINIS